MSILDRFLQRFWKCHDGVPLTVSFSASDPPKAPATSTTRGPNVTPWAEWQVKVATHYTPAGWTFYRFYLYAKRWNERAAPRVERSNTPVDVPHLVAELEAHNRIKPIEGGRSYGAVRNFCLYQSPKKPTFKHPFPDWCRTYVALDRRKEVDEENAPPPRDPPVTHSSPTSGENRPHRREEERREEERRGEPKTDSEPVVVVVGDTKAEETTTTTVSKGASQGKSGGLGALLGTPLPPDWVPQDQLCEKVLADFGMTIEDINAELPAFHSLNVQNGTMSQDWAATFYLYAKRWKERAAPRVERSNTPVDVPHLFAELEAHNCIKSLEGGRSYGAVRNFCIFQRPKKPTYRYELPAQFRTYVGLNADGSVKNPARAPLPLPSFPPTLGWTGVAH